MCAYKNSPLAIETAKKLIDVKVERQSALLKKYRQESLKTKIDQRLSLTEVLLEEGRVAKQFWKRFKKLIPNLDFPGRKPRGDDVVNKLLDVGYHHLINVVKKILEKYNIPADMGILHVARNSDSAPLAYDLVEMFRSDIVDAEVLRFLRLKKKVPANIGAEVSHFLHEINERLDKKYYLKDFKMCHSYRYYMEVQILKFVKAVNHKQVFDRIKLPSRHESRCDLTSVITSDKLMPELGIGSEQNIQALGPV